MKKEQTEAIRAAASVLSALASVATSVATIAEQLQRLRAIVRRQAE